MKSIVFFIVSFIFIGSAFSQTVGYPKSPADYASFYDNQLTKPRQTVDEIRLSKKIRQGTFARQLVRSLGWQYRLPLTATEQQCMNLLDRLGISPLKGWDRFAPLTEDDYAVVMGLAQGEEHLVHSKAQEVCDRIVKDLNVQWALHFAQNRRYPILEKLITEKSAFDKERYSCPYGHPFKIGGVKPQILPHQHFIKTPLKKYLYHEENFLSKSFPSRQNTR